MRLQVCDHVDHPIISLIQMGTPKKVDDTRLRTLWMRQVSVTLFFSSTESLCLWSAFHWERDLFFWFYSWQVIVENRRSTLNSYGILCVPCSSILQTRVFYHQAYLLGSMVTELVVGWTTSPTIAWLLLADVAPSSWPHPPEKRAVSNKIWGEGFWKISGSSHLDTHRDQGDRIELWTCCGFLQFTKSTMGGNGQSLNVWELLLLFPIFNTKNTY